MVKNKAHDSMDPTLIFFERVSNFPADVRNGLLTLRSNPSQQSYAVQLVLHNKSKKIDELIPVLKELISIDRYTTDLQFAESYLLEATDCLEARDYISASMLYEMGCRLCQRVEDALPPSELLYVAKRWRAECLANLGITFLNTNEFFKARKHLKVAYDILISINNQDFAIECEKLIAATFDDEKKHNKGDNPTSNQELIHAARETLYAGSLFKFIELTAQIIKLLDSCPLEERVSLASILITYNPKKTFVKQHLSNLIDRHSGSKFLQQGRFIWMYFTMVFCTYGWAGNPKLNYLAIRMLEFLSFEILNLKERCLFRELFISEYEDAFKWALSQRRHLVALRFAELMKGRSTLDLMSARRETAGPKHTTIEELAKLFVATFQEKQENDDKQNQNLFSSERWATIGHFESNLKSIGGKSLIRPDEEIFPFISINASRRLLNTDTLLLEYCIIEDLLHVFATPSTRFTDRQGNIEHWVTQIGIDENSKLKRVCAQLREIPNKIDSMKKSSALKLYEKFGGELYEILIGGVNQRWLTGENSGTLAELISAYHRLIIVPTGPLNTIPWNGLRFPGGWVWQKHLLSVLPSLSLLWTSAFVPRPIVRSVDSILLVGNPTQDLPGTEDECENIKELVEDMGIKSEILIGEEATIDAVRTLIQKYDVIHLACHGIQKSKNPADSYLHLADGKFFAQDLASLDLDGKAVVLSCCESGIGETTWNDDCFALAHACLIGGARYALGSLWKVEDHSTSLLMKIFYTNLLSGRSPQMSLNIAISKLIHDEKFYLPYDWAAFQIVGAPEDIDMQGIVKQTVEWKRGDYATDVLILTDPFLEEKRIFNKGL